MNFIKNHMSQNKILVKHIMDKNIFHPD